MSPLMLGLECTSAYHVVRIKQADWLKSSLDSQVNSLPIERLLVMTNQSVQRAFRLNKQANTRSENKNCRKELSLPSLFPLSSGLLM